MTLSPPGVDWWTTRSSPRPGANAIGFLEASDPLTSFAVARNPLGVSESVEAAPANLGLGWLPQFTPIRNPFLAGAWANTAGQDPAFSRATATETELANLDWARLEQRPSGPAPPDHPRRGQSPRHRRTGPGSTTRWPEAGERRRAEDP
jgi:hypothetical protein